MKRIFCFVLVFFSCLFLCVGCRKAEPAQNISHGLVAGVQVRCHFGQHTLIRHYRQPQKVDAFLTYLRQLRPMGPVTPPEESFKKASYEIVVILENGQRRLHRQCAEQYAAKNQSFWGIIDPEIGRQLPLLIFLIPGDEPAEI